MPIGTKSELCAVFSRDVIAHQHEALNISPFLFFFFGPCKLFTAAPGIYSNICETAGLQKIYFPDTKGRKISIQSWEDSKQNRYLETGQ